MATIAVSSAARLPDGTIAPRYTCEGADLSPPLMWAGVPKTARELAIVVLTIAGGHVKFNWVVAGISPSVRRVAAGRLPPGAIVGRNSFGKVGYTVCPPAGMSPPANVVLGVIAPPRRLALRPGFSWRALSGVLGHVPWGSVIVLASRPIAAHR